MKNLKRSILTLIIVLLSFSHVMAAPRVVYDMEPISDKKAEITLHWTENSGQAVKIEGFEVLAADKLLINYVVGQGGKSSHKISIKLDEVTFPLNIMLSNDGQIKPFTDLNFKGESLDAILNLYFKGVVNGYDTGEFKPYTTVTREEFATMLVKATEFEIDKESKSNFTDVADDRWSQPYITLLNDKGIVSGSNGLFRPTDKVTIGEIASMLTKTFMFYQVEDKTLQDDLKGHWAKNYMHTLYETDLMRVRDNFYNLSDRNATREDCALLLNRVLMSLKDVK